jgi:PAS domain S-box-containing protein
MAPARPPSPGAADTDDGTLETLAACSAIQPGAEFLAALVTHLAEALGARHALVAEKLGGSRARTLAWRGPGRLEPGGEWELGGTADEVALARGLLHLPRGAGRAFPRDARLAAQGAEGYLGAALKTPDGLVLGLLSVFDAAPLAVAPRRLAAFRIFAALAQAELARRAVERTLGESEERFRDLFDEAPIAYVHEGLDTRFIRANRAAQRAFEIGPEDVLGTYGKSFVVDNPDNQRRLKEAFASVGRGTDTSGVVLELRRRKSGKPLWIQWWSKPDPSGTYTRTMFVDITEKVLLEQEQARLKEQNRYLREEIKSVHNFEEIVGRSQGLLGVLGNVERVAATDATVLITGETGTGKELVARAIHSASKRHDKPLIKLNCAALPTGLVESELFGHEKGAFSGAIARRIGRFELAHGGTIFLDEIGDMPLEVQVKLLRVLQEKEFERVGGNTPIKADVRVIAATNRDLPRLVAQDRFRGDLYYRLNVFPLHLPPLRERAEDVPLLVQFFLTKFTARIGKPVEEVTPELMRRCQAYAWPGNVRELENLVERAVILTTTSRLDVDSVPALPGEPGAGHPSAPRPAGVRLETVEREHIRSTLEQTGWVIEGPAGAAKLLDLHPNTLRSRMKKLGIARGERAGT